MRVPIPHGMLPLPRAVTSAALVLAALAIIIPVGWRFAGVAYHQLCFPFDLCFETPNLATVKVIKDGVNPYSPNVYNALPFVLTMYTPLYHYLVAQLPIHSSNPFFYGRLVSLSCVVACALLCFLVHRRGRGQWACLYPHFAIYRDGEFRVLALKTLAWRRLHTKVTCD